MNRFHVALGMALCFVAQGVRATQSVVPAADVAGIQFTPAGANSWSVSRTGGQQLVFFGRYISDNPNESGLGLKIQYDATKITGVSVDQPVTLTKCMVFSPDIQVDGAVGRLLFGWADTSQRAGGAVGWPGRVDGTPPCMNPTPPASPVATTTAAFPAPTTLFRIVAVLAPGFTTGDTTTIAISSSSASFAGGAASFTNTSLVVNGTTAIGPSFVGALSRKSHGGTPFDLVLSAVTTNPTTEPRIGPNQNVILVFDKPVTAGTALVTEGAATVGPPTFSGNQMTVPLTGVANQQYVTVTATNVTAADGGTGGSGSVRIGFLLGDVNQNRVVTLSDLGQMNAQVAQQVGVTNYLKDVNGSGTLSLADKGITNAQLTKALPAP